MALDTKIKKILIVDDQEDTRFALKTWMRTVNKNWTSIEAKDGEECLRILKEGDIPAAIILDIMMPKMDGWETCYKIKTDPALKSVPIIFLTARTDLITKEMGDFMGDYFLEKPPDEKKLYAILSKLT